ncbi:MAG: hypothetical protein AABY00_03530 [Nanoarchaeota archaeon]
MNWFLVSKKEIFNYLGQLRIYSIVDLIFLLVALSLSPSVFAGILCLHLGFVLYLEHRHQHNYRLPFPSFLWIGLIILGILLYAKVEVIGFIFASYFYTQKKGSSLTLFAPFFRGFQVFFLVAGVVGYTHLLSGLALSTTFVRNALGDLRDVEKDKKEQLRTFPIMMGMKRSIPHIHLVGILLTTTLWWSFTNLSLLFLSVALILEIITYSLTPR